MVFRPSSPVFSLLFAVCRAVRALCLSAGVFPSSQSRASGQAQQHPSPFSTGSLVALSPPKAIWDSNERLQLCTTSKKPHGQGLLGRSLAWALEKLLRVTICRFTQETAGSAETGTPTMNSFIPQRLHGCYSQGWSDASDKQDPQSHTLVQVPLLNSDGHQQSPNKEHIGVLQVLPADLQRGSRERKQCQEAMREGVEEDLLPKPLTRSDCAVPLNLVSIRGPPRVHSSLTHALFHGEDSHPLCHQSASGSPLHHT